MQFKSLAIICLAGVAMAQNTPAPTPTGDHDHDHHDHTVSGDKECTFNVQHDHYHCPPGVPEPSTRPAGVSVKQSSVANTDAGKKDTVVTSTPANPVASPTASKAWASGRTSPSFGFTGIVAAIPIVAAVLFGTMML